MARIRIVKPNVKPAVRCPDCAGALALSSQCSICGWTRPVKR